MPTIEEYNTLAKLTRIATEATQAAYRYARDTKLYFSMPEIEYDADDDNWKYS